MRVGRYTDDQSRPIWTLMHDLAVFEAAPRKTRPIHAFTFLVGTMGFWSLGLSHSQAIELVRLSYALEAKLYAVKHFGNAAAEEFSRVRSPSAGGELSDWADAARFIAELEAFLGAVYSALEVTNQVARCLTKDVPIGFRKASTRKGSFFAFAQWRWLEVFYDLRTEFAHFNSGIPSIHEGRLIFDVMQKQEPHRLARRTRAAIAIASVLDIETQLFVMLDAWAMTYLQKLNPDFEITQDVFGEARGRIKTPLRAFLMRHLDVEVFPRSTAST
jgi:hypothetical protein